MARALLGRLARAVDGLGAYPGAARGGGRRGRSRGRRTAGGAARATASSGATRARPRTLVEQIAAGLASSTTHRSLLAPRDRRPPLRTAAVPARGSASSARGHVHRAGAAHPGRPAPRPSSSDCARSPRCSPPTDGRRRRPRLRAIENSIEGTVNVTLDALAFEHDLLIQREVVLASSSTSWRLPGVALADITRGRLVPGRHGPVPRRSSREPARRRGRGRQLHRRGRPRWWPRSGDAEHRRDRHRARPPRSTASTCSPPTSRTTPRTRPASSLVGRGGIPAPTGHDKTTIVVFQRADRPGSLLGDPPGVRRPGHQPHEARVAGPPRRASATTASSSTSRATSPTSWWPTACATSRQAGRREVPRVVPGGRRGRPRGAARRRGGLERADAWGRWAAGRHRRDSEAEVAAGGIRTLGPLRATKFQDWRVLVRLRHRSAYECASSGTNSLRGRRPARIWLASPCGVMRDTTHRGVGATFPTVAATRHGGAVTQWPTRQSTTTRGPTSPAAGSVRAARAGGRRLGGGPRRRRWASSSATCCRPRTGASEEPASRLTGRLRPGVPGSLVGERVR